MRFRAYFCDFLISKSYANKLTDKVEAGEVYIVLYVFPMLDFIP